MNVDVVLSPAEFGAVRERELGSTTCVVFDVLRATSSMLTALQQGAEAIIPVAEIAEALALRQQSPQILLAGERHGLRISAELTGGVAFDFGNSPRDFTRDRIEGRTIAWTTTNGTRALRACGHAEMILLGGVVNLATVAEILSLLRPPELLLVCSGTFEAVALEDVLAAGALILLLEQQMALKQSDSAVIAGECYRSLHGNWQNSIARSLNASRLLSNPMLADDVRLCIAENSILLTGYLAKDGAVRRFHKPPLLA